jgi:sulfate transport system ATP-binding protein
VTIQGRDVTAEPPQRRGIGFVFQHYAAFKHLSVARNVAFGLEIRRTPKAEIAERVDELLRLVHLESFAHRLPSQLSGGQRQRMALARALAIRPSVLLLDEPFGALDAKVRKELRRWLRQLHEQMGLTSIFVTHDQEEALELADRVVVLDRGVIQQIGTPEEVYMAPRSGFVSAFVGDCNSLPVTVKGHRAQFDGVSFEIPVQRLIDGSARLDFRPHDVALSAEGEGLPLSVTGVYRRGGNWRVEGSVNGSNRIVEIDLDADEAAPSIGSRLSFTITRARIFREQENTR